MKTIDLKNLPRKFYNKAIESKHFQRMAGLITKEPEIEKWIFVLGCYNSGTTLVTEVIGNNPSIRKLPKEGVSLTSEMRRPEDFGWPRMWKECENFLRLNGLSNPNQTAKKIKKQWGFWIDNQTKYVVEKSISNALRIGFLNNYFENPKFVYIIRNGYAVAEGIRRKSFPRKYGNKQGLNKYNIGFCAEQWKRSDEVIENELDTVKGKILIKYEDLAENPLHEFEKIFDFLEIDLDKKGLREKSWKIHERRSKIKNFNNEAIGRLTIQEREIIRSVASKTLEKYEYTDAIIK